MKTTRLVLSCMISFAVVLGYTWSAQAETHYVSPTGSHVPPFTTWATAASNIQAAVDAASYGDTVLVTNGVYNTGQGVNPSARITVGKAIFIRSVNGPLNTAISGGNDINGGPVVSLQTNAVLDGFTVTGGNACVSGGGIRCQVFGYNTVLSNAVITNCVIANNVASGATCFPLQSISYGGGVYGGTLYNCVLSNNLVGFAGIGPGYGGSAYGGGCFGSAAYSCAIISNRAQLVAHDYIGEVDGGGASSSTLHSCLLIGNTAIGSAGGGFESPDTYAYGGGASFSKLYNCTVSGNNALGQAVHYPSGSGTPIFTVRGFGGGVAGGATYNSIIWGNTANADGTNFYQPIFSSQLILFTCTGPDPGGLGNITVDPKFSNSASGNYRLQSTSPCINAGKNSYVFSSSDLDNTPRKSGGTVDMGAFEFPTPTSIISYAWLQQYGFPLNGTADYLDPDNDGMQNWQEWQAWTVPTNGSSVLRMLSPAVGVSGATVSWQSVANVGYLVQRSTDLSAPFFTIQSNIVGQAGTTSVPDTNAAGLSPVFYRVGVQ